MRLGRKGPGYGTTVDWPNSDKIVAAPKNDGVTATIKQTPGAIGYIEYGYAMHGQMNMAELQNKAGKFVCPREKSGTEALSMPLCLRTCGCGCPTRKVRAPIPLPPITWMLFYKKYDDPNKPEAIQEASLTTV